MPAGPLELRGDRTTEYVRLHDSVFARYDSFRRSDELIEDLLIAAREPLDREVWAYRQVQLVRVLEVDTDIEIESGLPRHVDECLDVGMVSHDLHAERRECCPDFPERLLEALELDLSRVHSLMLGLFHY